MKFAHRSPDVLVMKDSTLFLKFMTLFMLFMGIGFFSMAADPNMRVRDIDNSRHVAGPLSRIAWVAFGIGCLVGSGFSALQRRAIEIDRHAHIVREKYGTLIPIWSKTQKLSDFSQLVLEGQFNSMLLLKGAKDVVVFDSGPMEDMEPLAKAVSEHIGLPVERTNEK